jgi:hypothetical protein
MTEKKESKTHYFAENAKKENAKLSGWTTQRILQEARERDNMLKEARNEREKMDC